MKTNEAGIDLQCREEEDNQRNLRKTGGRNKWKITIEPESLRPRPDSPARTRILTHQQDTRTPPDNLRKQAGHAWFCK